MNLSRQDNLKLFLLAIWLPLLWILLLHPLLICILECLIFGFCFGVLSNRILFVVCNYCEIWLLESRAEVPNLTAWYCLWTHVCVCVCVCVYSWALLTEILMLLLQGKVQESTQKIQRTKGSISSVWEPLLVFHAPFALLGYHIQSLSFCSSPGDKRAEGWIPEDEHGYYWRIWDTGFSAGFESQFRY